MHKRIWLAVSVGTMLATWLSAQEAAPKATLKVGDPAPALQPSGWLQGEPVTAFEKDKIYVVEFWATWCPPCRASIPHLNELQNKLKDKGVVVIGQNCWERQSREEVVAFVKELGEKMTYRVASDASNTMAQAWMVAAGAEGIPTAFVVDKAGRLAWIGHPLNGLDKVLDALLAGTFDPQAAAAERAREEAAQAQVQGLSEKLGQAVAEKKWDEALGIADEIKKAVPAEAAVSVDFMRFNLLLGKQDGKAALALARQLSAASENPRLLNELAWALATATAFAERDLELAHTLAARANRAVEGKDGAILDTFARVVFLQGDKAQAVTLQEQAVAQTPDEEQKKELEATLKSYRDGKLPPASEGDAPAVR